MATRTADYLDVMDRLPEGASLVIHQAGWGDYEPLLKELENRPHLRLSYHRGKLEIMSPNSRSTRVLLMIWFAPLPTDWA